MKENEKEQVKARLDSSSDFRSSKDKNRYPIFISNCQSHNDNDEDKGWELTWPIWHMLPRMERKKIAFDQGMSIGEFEEYMTLSRALHVKNEFNLSNRSISNDKNNDTPYDNSELYKLESRSQFFGLPAIAHNTKGINVSLSHNNYVDLSMEKRNVEDNNEDDANCFEKIEAVEKKQSKSRDDSVDAVDKIHKGEDEQDDLSQQDMIERGGYILLLPPELQHFIFRFLPVDYYALCSFVSRLWHRFTMSEPTSYKIICQRVYLQQSKRKILNVNRFTGGLYRNMLIERPRVKVQAGLYVLKYSHIKKIQRDMWTEIPAGAILETTYYRYLYFHDDNRVLYALTTAPPREMIARFLEMKKNSGSSERDGDCHLKSKIDKSAVWSYYEVQRFEVNVHISHPWHDVRMRLKILPHDETIGTSGIYHTLRLEKHVSSSSGNFDEYFSRDLVEYKVPSQPFQFLRDWRL